MSPLSARSRRPLALLGVCVFVIFVGACAHRPRVMAGDVSGFWSGVLRGFLIAFSFTRSLLTDVRIYAFPNSGGWYDFGYLLGAAMFLGGCGAGMEKGVPSGDRRLHRAESAPAR